MDYPIEREGNALVIREKSNHKKLAEITWLDEGGPFVIADHTWVDDSLRGGGFAGKLLDALVAEIKKEKKFIQPQCSYVVSKFEREPEKYDFINWNKQS